MRKFTSQLAAAASAAVIAGSIALFGLTAASASPAARPGRSGTEYLQLVSGSATSNRASVIVTGVFTTGGVDIQGNSVDTVKFPGGTFRIWHSSGTGRPHFSARTCLLTATIRGTYKLSHGTGRYAGIRGHGRYVARILDVGRRSKGQCITNQNAAPLASQTIIDAHGPVHLPH
jgi:hypothetical protein